MASNVKFEDNSIKFLDEFDKAGIAFLHETKDGLVSQTQRNTPVDTGDLKRSFGSDSFVDEKKGEAHIGSSLEYSVYQELGTGEYALEGKGRKGGWIYKSDKNGKFYRTKGTKPQRMLYHAYLQKKNVIVAKAAELFGKLGKK